MSQYPIPRWLFLVGFLFLAALGLGLASLAFTPAGLGQANNSVTIADGDQTITVQTSANTVAGALQTAHISLYAEDEVQPPPDSPLAALARLGQADTVITITRATPVEVTENGVTTLVRTHQDSLKAVLAEAGKTVAPGDSVYVNGQSLPTDQLDSQIEIPHSIIIQRAAPITIIDGTTSQTLTTAALTVGDALAQANLSLFVADGIEPALSAPLTPNLTINIFRSLPVTLEVDGRIFQTRTHYTTVAEVLDAAGVRLLGQDYSLPPLDKPPPADGSPIRVVRVTEQFITETKALPYETQYQAIADLEIDNSQVVQAGAYGTASTRIRVRYENGVEVGRTAEDTWTAIAPQTRVIGYGTKIVIRTVDTADGTLEYWRAVRMYATSYSASRAGTPVTAPWYGRTRSGKTLTIGMAAIDLRVMPLGTRLYVPNYGYVTAEDTGGGVKGKMIDLGYDDWNFINWHQYVTVYFLTPVPPADQIKWTIP